MDEVAWLNALDSLRYEEKKCLLTALETCPSVVYTESNPYKFVVCCDFDYYKAVSRAAKYWRVRCEVFGDDAFLPLRNGGALGDMEMEYMNLRVWSQLPADNHGRPVLFTNIGNVTPYWQDYREIRLRATFATIQSLVANEASQSKGIVFISLLGRQVAGRTHGLPDCTTAPMIFNWIETAFPFKLGNSFAVAIEPSNITRFAIRTLFTMFLVEHFLQIIKKFQIIVVKSTEDAAVALVNAGAFSTENLPVCLGGKYGGGNENKEDLFDMCTEDAKDDMTWNGSLEGKDQCFKEYNDLYQALIALPFQDTYSLFQAASRVPSLVHSDSNPKLYLRLCQQDAKLAAVKLANYWKTRCDMYGMDAFRKLTSSHSSALSPSDVKLLSSGYMELLPDDRQGRCVLFYDRNKNNNSASGPNLKCLFYTFQRVVDVLVIQQNVVVIFKDFTLAKDQVQMFDAMVQYAAEIFPFNVEFFLLCKSAKMNVDKTTLVSLHGCAEFVFCSDQTSYSKKLTSKGFYARYLPVSIGGTWTGPSKENSNQQISAAKKPGRKESSDCDTNKDVAPSEEFLKKQYNRLQSKKKRLNRKARLDKIKSEAEKVKRLNQELRTQHGKLEHFLGLAKREAKLYDDAVRQRQFQLMSERGGMGINNISNNSSWQHKRFGTAAPNWFGFSSNTEPNNVIASQLSMNHEWESEQLWTSLVSNGTNAMPDSYSPVDSQQYMLATSLGGSNNHFSDLSIVNELLESNSIGNPVDTLEEGDKEYFRRICASLRDMS